MQIVRVLMGALEHAGISSAQFLGGPLYEAATLGPTEARVSRTEFFELCARAAEDIGDPTLGLHWLGRRAARSVVPMAPLMAHASCLGQALESLGQFERLVSDEPLYELLEVDCVMTVRAVRIAEQPLPVQRFWAETLMVAITRLVRYFDCDARPTHVSFEHSAPAYADAYRHTFDTEVRFEQPHTELVIDRALLDVPGLAGDDELFQAIRGMAERRIMRLTQTAPYFVRVRHVLMQYPRPYRLDMRTLAGELGLSERSLRRQLASEGHSFRAIANDTLANIAKSLLADTHLSIQEVAYTLGFSHVSGFHDAFKRWTARTPSAYRQAVLRKKPSAAGDA